MRIAPLSRDDSKFAYPLLKDALPFDAISVVANEKLFGSNGKRAGTALGAWDGQTLVGVLATAGRWIKLIAVAPSHRRRGIGSSLVNAAQKSAGTSQLRVCDHPGNYLSPGIDARYTDAQKFLESCRFKVIGEVFNLRAQLVNNPRITDGKKAELVEKAASKGYVVRRAERAEELPLGGWIEHTFAPVWAHEMLLALAGPRQAVHLAFKDDVPVAFACADGNNQGLGWFGPAGTSEEHRGAGLGEALLISCLLDVRDTPEGGVIAWVGPREFYRKVCGAVEDRKFLVFEESR